MQVCKNTQHAGHMTTMVSEINDKMPIIPNEISMPVVIMHPLGS